MLGCTTGSPRSTEPKVGHSEFLLLCGLKCASGHPHTFMLCGRLHYFHLTLLELCILHGFTCGNCPCLWHVEAGAELDFSHSAEPHRQTWLPTPSVEHFIVSCSSTEGNLVRCQLYNRAVRNVPFLPPNPVAPCHPATINPLQWHLSVPNSISTIFKCNLDEIALSL